MAAGGGGRAGTRKGRGGPKHQRERANYEFGNHLLLFHHPPLLFHHPQEMVPFIEFPRDDSGLTYLETVLSPKLLSTHMPLSLFPKSIVSCGCRAVYMCREPKDAFVSRWHFDNKGVGDWVKRMTEDTGRKLDCIVEEKLKGSGLVL
uniref:Sulfotransferase n=1 Tax=Setaria viridis TaxID=4556 RepID=A0A4U6UUR9_SETVI|nr:hypothetical protein SEVIR_5G469000v2 [Setaria viridis]